MSLSIGNPVYLAPEVCGDGEFSSSSDIYSCALVLYFLPTGNRPFQDLPVSMSQLTKQIAGSVSEACPRLIRECWSEKPAERPTFADLLQNPERFVLEGYDRACFGALKL
jgi:serine/threonine protein kinase